MGIPKISARTLPTINYSADSGDFIMEKGILGTKILATVERKLLRVFYTLGIKCTAFDINRLSQCESDFKKVA